MKRSTVIALLVVAGTVWWSWWAYRVGGWPFAVVSLSTGPLPP